MRTIHTYICTQNYTQTRKESKTIQPEDTFKIRVHFIHSNLLTKLKKTKYPMAVGFFHNINDTKQLFMLTIFI